MNTPNPSPTAELEQIRIPLSVPDDNGTAHAVSDTMAEHDTMVARLREPELQEQETLATIQAIVGRTLSNWRSGDLSRFLEGLPIAMRDLVVIGKLIDQVQKGGFDQWLINGFGEGAEHLYKALTRLGTPSAMAAYLIVFHSCVTEDAHDPVEDELAYRVGLERADQAFSAIENTLIVELADYMVEQENLKS